MSSSDLRDMMDGLAGQGTADITYPEALSRHNRGLGNTVSSPSDPTPNYLKFPS